MEIDFSSKHLAWNDAAQWSQGSRHHVPQLHVHFMGEASSTKSPAVPFDDEGNQLLFARGMTAVQITLHLSCCHAHMSVMHGLFIAFLEHSGGCSAEI